MTNPPIELLLEALRDLKQGMEELNEDYEKGLDLW